MGWLSSLISALSPVAQIGAQTLANRYVLGPYELEKQKELEAYKQVLLPLEKTEKMSALNLALSGGQKPLIETGPEAGTVNIPYFNVNMPRGAVTPEGFAHMAHGSALLRMSPAAIQERYSSAEQARATAERQRAEARYADQATAKSKNEMEEALKKLSGEASLAAKQAATFDERTSAENIFKLSTAAYHDAQTNYTYTRSDHEAVRDAAAQANAAINALKGDLAMSKEEKAANRAIIAKSLEQMQRIMNRTTSPYRPGSAIPPILNKNPLFGER
jgi:hypothetical protein